MIEELPPATRVRRWRILDKQGGTPHAVVVGHLRSDGTLLLDCWPCGYGCEHVEMVRQALEHAGEQEIGVESMRLVGPPHPNAPVVLAWLAQALNPTAFRAWLETLPLTLQARPDDPSTCFVTLYLQARGLPVRGTTLNSIGLIPLPHEPPEVFREVRDLPEWYRRFVERTLDLARAQRSSDGHDYRAIVPCEALTVLEGMLAEPAAALTGV
jgi:hypothetical protein